MSAVAPATHAEARFITVAGGRGPVGKSVIAAQLAWALARSGRKVLLADLDIVSPSQHSILGLPAPRAGVAALLAARQPIGDALLPTAEPNLWLLGGGRAGLPAMSSAGHPLTASARRVLHQQLGQAGADVVVLDVGAGLGHDPLPLFCLGHHRLIVATGQAASVHEGFALLKAAVIRHLESRLRRAGQLALLEALRTRTGDRMADLLLRVAAVDPALADDIGRGLGAFGVSVIGNQLPDFAHVGALQAMCRMAWEYLGVSVPLVGWLRAGSRLPDLSGATGSAAGADEAAAFQQLAASVLDGSAFPTEEILSDLAVESTPRPRMAPPALPPGAQLPPGSAAESAAPVLPIADPPGGALRRKPHVYVRPPRRRRHQTPTPMPATDPAAADGPKRPRSRSVTLPGMPPRRNA